MAEDKELITAQVLAEVLDLSVETIWRYTREKKIPYIELGSKQYRYQLADVIRVLAGSSVQEKGSGVSSRTHQKIHLPGTEGFQ